MKSFTQYHNNLSEQKRLMKPLLKFTKKHIKSRDLITLSSFPEVQTPLKKHRQPGKKDGFMLKPEGIWFGIGDSWINWLESEMPDWAQPSIMKIEVNFSRMLNIRKDSDLDVFTEKYQYMDKKYGMWMADWRKVAEDYDGIIHWRWPSARPGGRSAGTHATRENPRQIWYGWDVRAGCIWNPAGIKKMSVFGRYDEDKKEYVKI